MAQSSWTDVANQALIKVGTQTITALTQPLVQARLCYTRLPFTTAVALRKYPWKSAMTTVLLAQAATPPPDPAWGYRYPYPTDILRVWAYYQGTPLGGINYGVNYIIRQGSIWSNDGVQQGVDANGNPITTGEVPRLTYVQNPGASPGALDPLLLEAIAAQLAADICYQLTESLPLKQELQKDADKMMKAARSVDSMESPEVFDIEASEFLTARFAGTGYMGPNNPGFPVAP
jgi:hypothetical protein